MDKPIINMADFCEQFVEDLEFDVLIAWADVLGICPDHESWFDDDYPDKENELRGEVAEAMNNVGKKV